MSEVEDGELLAVDSNDGPHVVVLGIRVDKAGAIIGGVPINYQRSPVRPFSEPTQLKKTVRASVAVSMRANHSAVYSHQSIGSNLLSGKESIASSRDSGTADLDRKDVVLGSDGINEPLYR